MRPFLLSIGLLLPYSSLSAQGSPPNILIILTDDMGTEEIDAYGEDLGGGDPTDVASTPNIDRLMLEGTSYLNAWSSPVCSPTRANILTGLYGFNTGVGRQITMVDNTELPEASVTTMAEMLKALNYSTAMFGKWHLERSPGDKCDPLNHGFDHCDGSPFGEPPVNNWSQYAPDGLGNCPAGDDGGFCYLVDYQLQSAQDWIDAQDGIAPWFCYLAVQSPYELVHRPSPTCRMGCNLGNDRACYKEAIEALDTHIGALVWDDTGTAPRYDNTVVFFIGDNGTPSDVLRAPWPVHSADGKGTLYERGINVPLIVWGDGIPANQQRSNLVHVVDVFETVRRLTNASAGPTNSIALPGLFGGIAQIRLWVFAELFNDDHPNSPCVDWTRAARTGPYKLIICQPPTGAPIEEFFDLSSDPLEMVNLIGSFPNTAAMQAYLSLKAKIMSLPGC